MIAKQTKSLIGNNDPLPIQFNITMGRNEVLWSVVPLFTAFLFIYSIYRKLKQNQKHALTLVDKITQESFQKFETVSRNVLESNNRMTEPLALSKLIPDQHVLVPLQEGSSVHSLPNGYIMKVVRKFEHRAVAEAILGRELTSNEIVHHIYAPKTDDNSPGNLCIMDRDQHDVFHTYLQREKNLKGRYPSVANQKRILKQHFEGILADEALAEKTFQFPPIKPFVEKFENETYNDLQH